MSAGQDVLGKRLEFIQALYCTVSIIESPADKLLHRLPHACVRAMLLRYNRKSTRSACGNRSPIPFKINPLTKEEEVGLTDAGNPHAPRLPGVGLFPLLLPAQARPVLLGIAAALCNNRAEQDWKASLFSHIPFPSLLSLFFCPPCFCPLVVFHWGLAALGYLWIRDFGFRIPDFLRISDLGFRISGLPSQVARQPHGP